MSPSSGLPFPGVAVKRNLQGLSLGMSARPSASTLRPSWAPDAHEPRGAASGTDRFSDPGERRSRVLPRGLSWDHTSTTPVTKAQMILPVEPCGPIREPKVSHSGRKREIQERQACTGERQSGARSKLLCLPASLRLFLQHHRGLGSQVASPSGPTYPRLRVLGAESEPLSGRASSNSICSSYNGERGSVGIEKESICPPTFLRVRSVPGPVLGAMHTATRTEIAPGPRVHSEPDT